MGATHGGWGTRNTEKAGVLTAYFQASLLGAKITCKLRVGCSRNTRIAAYHREEGEVCVIATVLPAEIA